MCNAGSLMDFLRKLCSGWWNLNVWSTTCGWGSTFTARIETGFWSWVLKMTRITRDSIGSSFLLPGIARFIAGRWGSVGAWKQIVTLVASHEKVPNVLCRCHMTPTFQKSQCHTKRGMGAATCSHPSFGMTRSQAIRDLFRWRRPGSVRNNAQWYRMIILDRVIS